MAWLERLRVLGFGLRSLTLDRDRGVFSPIKYHFWSLRD
jgi:hypothetical protein